MDFKKKILVVEDDKGTQIAIQSALDKTGFDVFVADNGEEALNKIRLRKPDLIVTDIIMPVMDGFHFYKELKSDIVMQDIPVIVLTAKGAMEDAFNVLGVDSFLVKPFNPEILINAVNKDLRKEKVKYLSNKKILIAGSIRSILDEMVDMLRKEDSEVQIVEDISGLKNKIETFSPDIAILEIDMHGASIDSLSDDVISAKGSEMPIFAYQNTFNRDTSSYSVIDRLLAHDDSDDVSKKFIYIGRYVEDKFISKLIKCLALKVKD